MLSFLVCLSVSGLAKQPSSIDVVSYQRVQHALPNGAPDTKAPDNFYIRVKSHYVLAVDSEAFEPDGQGVRHVDAPSWSTAESQGYTETGLARGRLADLFKEVLPALIPGRRDLGKTTFGRDQQTVPKGFRYLSYRRKTTVESVETHSDRDDRVTRISWQEGWGVCSTMGYADKVFDPSGARVFWSESKPEVRIDPPVYKFPASR